MKKKMALTLLSIVMALFAGYNIYSNLKVPALSGLVLSNIEALAGCESPVQTLYGTSAELTCINSHGESYTISACDFSLGYDTDCTGREAND